MLNWFANSAARCSVVTERYALEACASLCVQLHTPMPRVKIGGFLGQTLADLDDFPAPPRVSTILSIFHLGAQIFSSPYFFGFRAPGVPRLDSHRRAVQDRPILRSRRPPGAELRPLSVFWHNPRFLSFPHPACPWLRGLWLPDIPRLPRTCPHFLDFPRPFRAIHSIDWEWGFGVEKIKSLSTRGGRKAKSKISRFF